MIDQLINIGGELEGNLKNFFAERGLSELIRGVQLDVDDYWEHRELLHSLGDEFYIRRMWLDDYFLFGSNVNQYWDFLRRVRGFFNNSRVDFGYRPGGWEQHCASMGYGESSGPIIIRAILREELKNSIHTRDFPTSFQKEYPIVYEYRFKNKAKYSLKGEIGRLLNKIMPGWNRATSIGTLSPYRSGTLGGVLKGTDFNYYAVTCAHVLNGVDSEVYRFRPSPRAKMGEVRLSIIPGISSTNQQCSNFSNSNLQSVDVAVTDWNFTQRTIHELEKYRMSRVAPLSSLRKNDEVYFCGKVSGIRKAKIGALTLWDKITYEDGERCFGRVFQLKPREYHYIREDLAQRGDSGSWIIRENNNLKEWCGMVISCDADEAYGCFAEYILSQCNSAMPNGVKLSLIN